MSLRTTIRWLAYFGGFSILVFLLGIPSICSAINLERGYGEYEDAENELRRASEARSPQWFPGGDCIVFSHRGRVYTIDSLGSSLHEVHDREKKGYSNILDLAYAPSVSPDGSRIAYAAYKESGWFLWKSESWEIMTAKPDGSDKHQLTNNDKLDTYPFWSTDGTSIFFVSQPRAASAFRGINVMASDGSETKVVYPKGNNPVSGPPTLSPDGSRIAFIVDSIKEVIDASSRRYVHHVGSVYLIEADGSSLAKLAEDAGSAMWSPDGTHLAFAGRFPLNSTTADGIRTINLHTDDSSETMRLISGQIFDWTDSISWSPDGSEIMFGPFVIKTDGSDMRRLPGPGNHTSWSPDGSRIAIYAGSGSDVVLYTVAPDGSDARLLVEEAADGSLIATNGRPLGQP